MQIQQAQVFKKKKNYLYYIHTYNINEQNTMLCNMYCSFTFFSQNIYAIIIVIPTCLFTRYCAF